MANKRTITPRHLEQYRNSTLREIEHAIEEIKKQPTTTDTQFSYRIARQALSQRQREIKSKVTEFEATNSHYLLFFDSTAGFAKLSGHSVLFFSMTIADRIHWRYSIKSDTDHYSVSEDGIISFRSLDRITELLAEIDILPDSNLSTTELHFFTLPKVYSDDQVATLRDHAKQDLARISSIVLPHSPIPALYDAIIQVAHTIYYQFKHLSDSFARETIGTHLVLKSYELTSEYHIYANTKRSDSRPHLVKIIQLSHEIRSGLAYASRLRILHHREICKILDNLVIIERIAANTYRKLPKATNV